MFFLFKIFSCKIFIFLTSLLEYNCFTMVCQFLLYNKVNQLYIYIYPHISYLLRLPPSHPLYTTPLGGHKPPISLCYAAASHQLSILCLVVYICPCHSLTLSQLTLLLPHILKSILQQICIFIPVLPLGFPALFFFQIPYICVINMAPPFCLKTQQKFEYGHINFCLCSSF